MHTQLHISSVDRRPMYLQLIEQIRHRIALGDWLPGSAVPSIRTLAASARVSAITVRRAYRDLEQQGLLVTRQGLGTFVADQVNLDSASHEEELQAHMQAALSVAMQMGLTEQELQLRWSKVAESAKDKPGD